MYWNISPMLSVRPSRALVDETFKVVVENLSPGHPVTLHSLHQSEDKDFWEAYGHYMSDPRGTVSAAEDLSLGGTYRGKEPMGLLWSMRPVPGSRENLRLRKTNVCSPMLVNISVYSGHVSEGFRHLPPLASVLSERWYMAPGVKRIDIREKNVRGTLFIPPGPGCFPGLLDMWGSGGGLIEYRAALLASHGYASLALGYFDSGELETADTDYYETAFDILKQHPQVVSDKVGVFGLCLGSTLSLYMAAERVAMKPACCVGVSSSHVLPRGEPLAGLIDLTMRDFHKHRVDENNNQIWRDIFLPISSDLSGKIDVRMISCPLLLVNGADDQNQPTVECAEDMAQMMQSVGKDHLLTRLTYPATGHLIEPPFSPHFRATKFFIHAGGSDHRVTLLWGGETKPHADAQQDSWKKILAFLQQHLYSTSSPRAKM